MKLEVEITNDIALRAEVQSAKERWKKFANNYLAKTDMAGIKIRMTSKNLYDKISIIKTNKFGKYTRSKIENEK